MINSFHNFIRPNYKPNYSIDNKNNFRLKYILTYFILLMFIGIACSYEASAIPAFARKYKTSCMTCHIAVTKRNAFGEAFRRNGYVMPERNARLIKDPVLPLGAEAWKGLFPDAIWPSNIPGTLPVAAYTQMRIDYDFLKPVKGNQTKFTLPYDIGLLFGGAFGEDIGFFGNYSALNGLYKFFLRFNDIAGPRHWFNIRLGRFEPGITEGLQTNQLLTLDYAAIHNYAAAGDWTAAASHETIELNGIIKHFFQYNAGVSNSLNFTLNPSYNKDYYARLGYKIAGYGLDGDGISTDSTSNNYWRDDSFTLGLYGYSGNTQKLDQLKNVINNQFTRFGFDARYKWANLDLFGGAVMGKDYINFDDSVQIKSNVFFVEADYIFFPWLLGAFRYENVHSTGYTNDRDKYYNIVPNFTILFRQNVRFTFQGLISNSKNLPPPYSINNSSLLKWIKFNTLVAF